MRINEWNQKAADTNGISGRAGKANTKKLCDISVEGCKVNPEADSFRSSLQKSLVQEEAMKEYRAKAEEAGRTAGAPRSRREHEIGQNRAESINIRMERAEAGEAREVPVRQIAYQECDMVEVNVLEGYVLKAKKDGAPEEGQGSCRIYVEKKSDDGEYRAYLFDGEHSRQDSRDEMERMAYAVMHRGERL